MNKERNMNAIDVYFGEIRRILEEILETQRDSMEKAAEAIAEANITGHNIFAFGCNHAGLPALELFYRAGGMVTINPIRAPGMMLEPTPITLTSEMERLPGYGDKILRGTPAGPGDVLLIHSVSGRNAVSIDMALAAQEIGMTVVVVTNMNTTSAVSSRHPSGTKLCDCGTIVLDNRGCKGDAVLSFAGMPEKSAPSSTVSAAAILNAIVGRAIEIMLERGEEPPVFISANLDGGDVHNRKILEKYKAHIFYM